MGRLFIPSNGLPWNSNATLAEIDLAARGAAWGDAVGTALVNNIGPLSCRPLIFIDDAAQGTAIYGASL